MAVTADNQTVNHTVKDYLPRDDESKSSGIPKQNSDVIPKKKSTFKITSVTKVVSQRGGSGDPLTDADGDSMDDLDESHTEDASSEIFDSSKTTDLDQDTPSEDITHNITPDPDVAVKEKTDMMIHSRFKVVKIDTKLRRGRWTCYDFKAAEKADPKTTEETSSGNSSTPNSIHFVYGVDDPTKNPLFLATSTDGTLQPVEGFQPIQHHIPSGSIIVHPGMGAVLIPGQPLPPGSVQQTQILHTTPTSSTTNIKQTISQQNLPQNVPQQSGHDNASLSHSQNIHNVTKPQVQLQTGGNQQVPIKKVGNPQIQTIQQGLKSMQNPEILAQTGGMSISVPVSSQVHDAQSQIATPLVNHSQISQSTQAGGVPSQPIQTFVVNQTHVTDASKQHVPVGQKANTDFVSQDNTQTSATIPIDSAHSTTKTHSDQSNVSVLPQISSSEVSRLTNMEDADIQIAADLLTPLEVAVSSQTREDENESGSSSVAIDNKIEQAMDLVKSHLMYAVREEVEVLKEQIKELIEKNNQLEYENSILKAAASQETLLSLSQPRPQQPSSSS
ncbi:hypothetical protein ScPMuIL_017369 [Solemya velum]